MSLGKLVVDLILEASTYLEGLDKSEQATQNFVNKLNSSLKESATELAKWGAGFLAAHKLIETFQEAAHYGEEIKKASAQTGAAAEEMDKWALAAKYADATLGDVVQGMNKLSIAASKAEDSTSEQAQAFEALGVSTKNASGELKSNEELFGEVIKAMGKFRDDANLNLIAMTLTGKGFKELKPLVKEYDESMAQAAETTAAFGAETEESTHFADMFGDDVGEIGEGFKRLFIPIVNAAAVVVDGLKNAFVEIGPPLREFMSALGAVAGFLTKVVYVAVAQVWNTIKSLAIGLVGVVDALISVIEGHYAEAWNKLKTGTAAATESWTEGTEAINKWYDSVDKAPEHADKHKEGVKGIGDATDKAAAASKKYAEQLADEYRASGLGISPQTYQGLMKLREEYEKGGISIDLYNFKIDDLIEHDSVMTEEARKNAAARKQLAEEQRKEREEIDKLVTSLEDEYRASQMAMAPATYKGLQDVNKAYKEGTLSIEAYNWKTEQLIKNDPILAEQQKKVEEGLKNLTEARYNDLEAQQKSYEEGVKGFEDMQKEVQQQEVVIAQLGMDTHARALNNIERKTTEAINKALLITDQQLRESTLLNIQAEHDRAVANEYTIHTWEQNTKAAQDYAEALDRVNDYGRSFFESFADGMQGVSDWVKRAGQDIKKWLLDVLYEMTAKRWVVNLAASLGGGEGPGGGLMGAIGGGAGGLAGYFQTASIESQPGFVGPTTAELAGGSTQMMALAGAVGTILPWVGVAVAAFSFIKGFIDSHGGGPKSGGFAESGVAGVGRFVTPSDRDADIQKFTDGVEQGFTNTLKTLGGTGRAGFALGVDVDPQGSAQSRVSGAVYNAQGQVVYQRRDREVGRSQQELEAGVSLETKRMLLAALQVSDLPPLIGKVLNSVVAEAASETDVDTILGVATAIKQVTDNLAVMADPMKTVTDILSEQNKTLYDQYMDQADALDELLPTLGTSVEDLNALNQASAAYAAALVQLLGQIAQMRDSLRDMFAGTKENILKAITPKDERYKYLQDQSKILMGQISASSDPAEIERLSKKVNDYINEAFGMLTPEEQQKLGPQYLKDLDATSKFVDDKLKKIAEDVKKRAEEDQKKVSDMLTKIVDGITAAGGKFDSGANTIQATASNGINVKVTIDDTRSYAEVSSGNSQQ